MTYVVIDFVFVLISLRCYFVIIILILILVALVPSVIPIAIPSVVVSASSSYLEEPSSSYLEELHITSVPPAATSAPTPIRLNNQNSSVRLLPLLPPPFNPPPLLDLGALSLPVCSSDSILSGDSDALLPGGNFATVTQSNSNVGDCLNDGVTILTGNIEKEPLVTRKVSLRACHACCLAFQPQDKAARVSLFLLFYLFFIIIIIIIIIIFL